MIGRSRAQSGAIQSDTTFHFAPSPELAAIGRGSRWCQSKAGLDDFAAYVRSTAPMQALELARARRIVLDHELV